MYYLNNNLIDLERVFDQNKRSTFLRLDLNENPTGMPENVVRKVLDAITASDVAEYPETHKCQSLIAKHIGADVDQVCLTNGSAEAIRYIIEAYTNEGGKIVGVDPSYFMFEVYSKMYNRNWVKVKYREDLTIDINDILNELAIDTQLLCLMNPNNPIGNFYSDREFETILEKCKENKITLLVDEAYFYFHNNTFIKYALENENVFVTRTFSKLFSMAGCRLGYVVGKDVKYIQKLCTPHNTNVFSLRFAETLLQDQSLIDQLITEFVNGQQFLYKKLDELGYRYKKSAGNFVFIKQNTNAYKVVERMKKEKSILIKAYSGIGEFGDCLRVTIGNKECMKQFIDALIDVDKVRVITYGTYDLYHYGHKQLLERAKALGDYLIVGVTSDQFDKDRGKLDVVQSYSKRVENIVKSNFADEIVQESYNGQKIDDIKKYDIDIFTLGSDWEGKYDYLKDYCKVVYLPRTEGISSTKLRKSLYENTSH